MLGLTVGGGQLDLGLSHMSHLMSLWFVPHRSLTIRPASELQVWSGGKLELGVGEAYRGCSWGGVWLRGTC